MFKKSIHFFIIVLFTVFCSTTSQITSLTYKDYQSLKKTTPQSDIAGMLQPYSVMLSYASLNKTIFFFNKDLQDKLLTNGIINFMTVGVKSIAEKKLGNKADAIFTDPVAVCSCISKQNITGEKVPGFIFFGDLVMLTTDGLRPLSPGAALGIKGKKTLQATISGRTLHKNATYLIVNREYIADNAKFLQLRDRDFIL